METECKCCQDVGFLIKQIDDMIKKNADARMAEFGITITQSRILFFLAQQENREAQQKEIEKFLGVAHPTVVGVIRRMEEKEYISTSKGTEDKRKRIVSLTPKAEEIMGQIMKQRKSMEQIMLKNISQEEKAELVRMLHIIKENVKEVSL